MTSSARTMGLTLATVLLASALTVGTLATPASAQGWPPPGGRIVDGIVAIVNSEPVTLFELERAVGPYVRRIEGEGATVDDTHQRKIRTEIIESLVNDILIMAEARGMRLEPDQKQVDAQLERLKQGNSWTDEELGQALLQHGFASVSDYRKHMERELLKNQVLSIKVVSRVRIDEDEVQRALRDELNAGEVQQRRAAHILIRLDEFATPDQITEAEQLLAELRERATAGEETFEDLARRYSQDSNASSGGDLGFAAKGDLTPGFEAALWKLTEPGQISPPIKTDFGYHLIKLVEIRTKALGEGEEKEALLRQIRYRLREGEVERLYKQWIKGVRAQAFIEIRRAFAGLE